MAKKTNTNFSSTKVLRSETIHYGIRDQFGAMLDWLDERVGQSLPEIRFVAEVLDHYATPYEGETYLAREHINRFCNLVIRVSVQSDDEQHPDADLLRSLRDLSGRSTLNGGEIRAIRRRRNRGEE